MRDMPMMPHRGEGRRGEGRPSRKERSLAEISVTVWLTPDLASFSSKNGLLYMTYGEQEQRVTLRRQFPMDMLWEYISVMDEEEHEVGILRELTPFVEETQELLRAELEKRYYTQKITAILSAKERYGFSYWKVRTQEGEMRFTLRDTMKSISTTDGVRVFFSDIHGNRFEVEDLRALDAASRRRLELYV